jgi:LPXTG-site transpeptidase (sortase) family protein
MRDSRSSAGADEERTFLARIYGESTFQKVAAVVLSVLILAGLGFLGYILYDNLTTKTKVMGEGTSPEGFVPLTHDELLGRPLSFETPAFIRIPRIDLKQEIMEGSDDKKELSDFLSLGPVHITHTGYPGWDGNCVISGHKNAKTKPFQRLQELQAGDAVFIDNPRGTYQYAVQQVFSTDFSKNVTLQTADPVLTLMTCPESGESERLVVKASLTGFIPVEAQGGP